MKFIDISEILEHAETNIDITAFLKLGDMYKKGHIISKDLGKASYYYKKAADLGSGEGMYKLSLQLRSDRYASDDKADVWLEKSLDEGYVPELEVSYFKQFLIVLFSMVSMAGFLYITHYIILALYYNMFPYGFW